MLEGTLRTLKNTKSICPICYKEISAKVIKENEKIFLVKRCDHCKKRFKNLLEKNARLYEELMNKSQQKRNEFRKLILPVTNDCNLKCPVCYENGLKLKDLALKEIREVVSRFDGEIVVISGGEPTLRKDLPSIISLISKRHISVLATNGILLTDRDYLETLKQAGLDYVLFSFNSFNDKTYEKINGRRLLKVKLKALANLKNLKMRTVLSVMVIRNVNEDELGEILKFAIGNSDFIKELRIRVQAPFGRYVEQEKMTLSEIIEELSKVIRVETEEILAEIGLRKAFYKASRILTGKVYTHKPCSLRFHIKIEKNETFPIGRVLEPRRYANTQLGHLISIINFIRLVGLKSLVRWALSGFDITRILESSAFLSIALRVWPDKKDVDLNEIRRCQTAYPTGNGLFPFCYRNVMKN